MKHVDIMSASKRPHPEVSATFTLQDDGTVTFSETQDRLDGLIPKIGIFNRISTKVKRFVTMNEGLLFLQNLPYEFHGSYSWATKVLD
ncbi:MAG: hypothetical protein HZA08_08470 [Nitrospirae bacterium]|nr:hypothetical protein [Nitrospirota bacterium]